MRELIERFSYRFQLWQRERHGNYSPADPAARNPLRFVAIVAVMSVILELTEPFVFHRAFDVIAIINISVAVVFLALYQLKSRWAWHLVLASVPFTLGTLLDPSAQWIRALSTTCSCSGIRTYRCPVSACISWGCARLVSAHSRGLLPIHSRCEPIDLTKGWSERPPATRSHFA